MSLKKCKHSDIKISFDIEVKGDKEYTTEIMTCNSCGKIINRKVSLSYLPSNKTDK